MTGGAAVVNVVILARNEAHHLQRSLPTLLNQDIEVPFDVTVIDSGSVDGSVELVRHLADADPRLRLLQIDPAAFHHARTRNLGAEATTGRYLVYLGGDAVPIGRSWLRDLTEPVMDPERPDLVAAYGRQVARPGAGVANVARTLYNYGPEPVVKRLGAGLSPKELHFFSSVACCVDRAAVSLPLFDPEIPVNEDVTLSRRIISAGLQIAYVPTAVVEHSHEYSSREILRRYFDNAVVYQRLGIFGRGGDDVSRGDAWQLLGAAREALRGRGPIDYLRVVIFLGASFAGVQLGRHRTLLPKRLQRALTVYGTVD